MATDYARGAICVPSLSVVLAVLATTPLWTSAPTLAGIFVAVLVALATAALSATTAVEQPITPRSTAQVQPADHARVLLAQFAAGVRGSRAPPVTSA